jgi:hypothetical protein
MITTCHAKKVDDLNWLKPFNLRREKVGGKAVFEPYPKKIKNPSAKKGLVL